MTTVGSYLDPCPSRIAIIGGGRWARVLTVELCDLVPLSTIISIHTFNNSKLMSEWVADQEFANEVYVSADWPQFNSENIGAMIVVNAARDHEVAIEKGLNSRVPILVEKPVTLSYASSQRLVELARRNGTLFASAHIFLFARYLENFSRLVTHSGRIRSIQVDWMDPKSENRYGEQKHYDPGLPIFADWLPHVLSIVGMLAPKSRQKCNSLDFNRGGSDVELELMLGDIPCNVRLVRNGDVRKRTFKVDAEQQLQLDFSKEPGTIAHGTSTTSGDTEWGTNKQPAAIMLSSFLMWSAGGLADNRLSIDIGLQVNRVIDEASNLYNSSLSSWLKCKLSQPVLIDYELQYALREVILTRGPLPVNEIKIQIGRIQEALDGSKGDYWYKKLIRNDRPFEIIRLIASGCVHC